MTPWFRANFAAIEAALPRLARQLTLPYGAPSLPPDASAMSVSTSDAISNVHEPASRLATETIACLERTAAKADGSVLVIEPDRAALCAMLDRADFVAAIASGRLRLALPALATVELAEVSLLECTAMAHEVQFRGGHVDGVLGEAIPASWRERFARSLDQAGWSASSLHTETPSHWNWDVSVISPCCAIFNDLAECFRRLGWRARRVQVPDRPNDLTLEDRKAGLAALGAEPSRLVLARNRAFFETSDASERIPGEHMIPGTVLSWWWDVPNVASRTDAIALGPRPALAFARGMLPYLGPGSAWLPPGARSDYAARPFEELMDHPKDLGVVFVGQSRAESLLPLLERIETNLAVVAPSAGERFRREIGRARIGNDLAAAIQRARETIAPALLAYEQEQPYAAWYLSYLLGMAETAAGRIEAVAALKDFPLMVFGDEGWIHCGAIPRSCFGGLLPPERLVEIAARSRLSLVYPFFQVSTGVHPRVLDLGAAGAAVLTKATPELSELFPHPDARPATFSSLAELPELVSQLLDQPQTAATAAIARHVRQQHLVEHRAREIARWVGLPSPQAR